MCLAKSGGTNYITVPPPEILGEGLVPRVPPWSTPLQSTPNFLHTYFIEIISALYIVNDNEVDFNNDDEIITKMNQVIGYSLPNYYDNEK